MENNSIAFIMNYARSGGTLLNRYLHNIEDLVILSEAHPIHSTMMRTDLSNIVSQAREWYGINVKSLNYIDQIGEIKEWCDKNGKKLVIRDWSYIDFTPSWENKYNPPKKSVNLELLEKRYEVKKIAFVRNAIDVFMSRGVKIDKFSPAYLEYSRYVKNNLGIYKYEDFCSDPQKEIHKICEALDIKKIFKSTNLCNTKKVVGDTKISRGNTLSKPTILKRAYKLPYIRKTINNNSELKEANELFNYAHKFNAKEVETLFEYVFKKVSIKGKVLKLFIKKWST